MILVGVELHKSPPLFSIASALFGSSVVSISVLGNHQTMWFANRMIYVEIPSWVVPACAIAAHCALDIFYAATRVDLRKCTLP